QPWDRDRCGRRADRAQFGAPAHRRSLLRGGGPREARAAPLDRVPVGVLPLLDQTRGTAQSRWPRDRSRPLDLAQDFTAPRVRRRVGRGRLRLPDHVLGSAVALTTAFLSVLTR